MKELAHALNHALNKSLMTLPSSREDSSMLGVALVVPPSLISRICDTSLRFTRAIVSHARFTASSAGVHVGDRIVIREVPHRITTIEHEFRGQTHITRITVDEPAGSCHASHDVVRTFLRYHVLIRVFHGDVARWRMFSREAEERTFLASLRRRLQANPGLLADITRLVGTSGVWP